MNKAVPVQENQAKDRVKAFIMPIQKSAKSGQKKSPEGL
jgi:hypothetical protein